LKTKYLVGFILIGALAFIEVTVLRTVDITRPGDKADVAAIGATAGPGRTAAPAKPYDVAPLVLPAKKYLGVTVDGGAKMDKIELFAQEVGKKPNLVAIFESFRDSFAASEVRKVHEYGALAVIRWEPRDISMAELAAGKHDDYVIAFAKAVRTLNLPIALTFGHEMNGNWYNWGTTNTKPTDFVAAWRHIHELFAAQAATNVLWTWTPNVITYLKKIKLSSLYPGDQYVDWIGIDGYYAQGGPKTFKDLFGPTIDEIRTLSKKPVLIVETGAEPGSSRAAQIDNLLSSVAASPDVIGCVYFNLNATKKWNIDADVASKQAFAKQAAADVFGFTVKDLK
jgi:hypothetical protein